jgi:activator of HSP90 ATPase
MQETASITQTVTISAKPVQVYDAFVNAKKHSDFTGAKATGEGKVGASFTAWDGYITGTYVELARARRIVQEWQTTEWPKEYPPSKLEFTFEESNGGTKVTMVHSEVPASQAEAYRQGWFDYYWTPLQEYFSRG